jgi:hypothetical protein
MHSDFGTEIDHIYIVIIFVTKYDILSALSYVMEGKYFHIVHDAQ